MAAGADGFVAKPISSIHAFQAAVLAHVPKDRHPPGPRAIAEDTIEPDSIAFHDDIAHAQEALLAGEAAYAAQFVESLARCVNDHALSKQAEMLAWSPKSQDEQGKMASMLAHRLGTREAV